MGLHTNISWPDSTINPTTGCEGCELWNGRDIKHCYAGCFHEKRLAKSLPLLYDADFQKVRLAPGRMMQAARWSDLRGKPRPDKPHLDGLPRLIFVGDMADFCSKQVPTDYIVEEIIGAIRSTPGQRHFWLLLTKQIHRLADISQQIGGLPDNSMAMTTITDQHFADKRLPHLYRTLCKYRGVSAEPLLGPINLPLAYCNNCFKFVAFGLVNNDKDYGCVDCGCFLNRMSPANRPGSFHQVAPLDWLIVGGESGEGYREMDAAHARHLRDQCRAAGVPFFYKQGSAFRPGQDELLDGARLHAMPALVTQ